MKNAANLDSRGGEAKIVDGGGEEKIKLVVKEHNIV